MGWIILAAVATAVVAALVFIIIILQLIISADRNSNSAMEQIGLQIAKQYDAIMELLSLANEFSADECEEIIDTIKKTSSKIIESSSVSETLQREKILLQAVARLHETVEKYPEIKSNQQRLMNLDTVNSYDSSVKKYKLQYNENVKKLNGLISHFPGAIFAKIMHIDKRDGKFDI